MSVAQAIRVVVVILSVVVSIVFIDVVVVGFMFVHVIVVVTCCGLSSYAVSYTHLTLPTICSV